MRYEIEINKIRMDFSKKKLIITNSQSNWLSLIENDWDFQSIWLRFYFSKNFSYLLIEKSILIFTFSYNLCENSIKIPMSFKIKSFLAKNWFMDYGFNSIKLNFIKQFKLLYF